MDSVQFDEKDFIQSRKASLKKPASLNISS